MHCHEDAGSLPCRSLKKLWWCLAEGHLFSVHDPYGIHNTWLGLSSLGPFSSETATLKTFCVASHAGPVTQRLSRGWIVGVDIAASAWAKVGPSNP